MLYFLKVVMNVIPVGNNLRILRNERNWSQAQVAKRLGVSASIIAHYETGERFPSLENLISLSRLFSVSTDYLLGIDTAREFSLDITGLTAEQVEPLQKIIDNFRKNI